MGIGERIKGFGNMFDGKWNNPALIDEIEILAKEHISNLSDAEQEKLTRQIEDAVLNQVGIMRISRLREIAGLTDEQIEKIALKFQNS